MGRVFLDTELEGIKKRNKNKFYEEKYSLSSEYFNIEDKRIAIFSDIHYHPHVDKDLYKLLVFYVKMNKPDYVIMPGDQVETISFIDNQKERDFFEYIIRTISEVCPVIIIPGNHEQQDFSPKNFKNRLISDESNAKAMRYFESLNRINNVYFLDNAQTKINGVTFLGFTPRPSSYQKKGDKNTEDEFIEDYLKSGLKMTEEEYNVLLTHTPIQLTSERVFSSISDFSYLTDLVITGHLHDGYLPKFLDKRLGKTNAGLFFTPLVAPYPGIICRGVHDFGRGYLFVSQGFRKWTADVLPFNIFELITANDVEEITITKKLTR